MTDITPIIAVTAALGGSASSAVVLGWWLSGRFRSIEKAQRVLLSAHEVQDQKRHEENLERFRGISVALARLGYTNGSP